MAREPNPAFNERAGKWMDLARFPGRHLLDVESRIAKVVALWEKPIPPGWKRESGRDSRLLKSRYGRGRKRENHVPRGEHAIEHEILDPSPAVPTRCLGATLVDGVNAVPLAKDAGGGRAGNVEADMLLLVEDEQGYRLQLVEVKATSDNPWFAAVENLRQMRLFRESPIQSLFRDRCSAPDLGEELRVTGIVLAPNEFYEKPVKRRDSVAPAQELLDRMNRKPDVDMRLATWNANFREIESLPPRV